MATYTFVACKLLTICMVTLCSFGLSAQPVVTFTPYVTGLASPTDLVESPLQNGDLYVVQRGIAAGSADIRLIRNGVLLPIPFVTVTGISCCGERGLLSMVFHPDFATNRTFFVLYTAATTGAINIARYYANSATDPTTADAASKQDIISIPHPGRTNHNGGKLIFGADGLLYLGTGDGGGSNDPDRNAQDPQSLLGKMIRITPSVTATSPPFYTIPADNPYVASGDGIADEIYAMGLRNPWRWTFDSQTGNAWIADVGQANWEELTVVTPAQFKGANFGWRCFEGQAANNASGIQPCTLYNNQPHVAPQFVYGHNPTTGGRSVTGGVVYRGNTSPALTGLYIMADYITPAIWLVDPADIGAATRQSDGVPGGITGFAATQGGDLYAISLSQNTVYRVTAESPLSLSLLQFTGTARGSEHLLQWRVSGQQAGTQYSLERKAASQTRFEKVQDRIAGELDAQNFEVRLNAPVNSGQTIYRLQITAPNGITTYSQQLVLQPAGNAPQMKAYAAGGQLFLNWQGEISQIRVLTLEGKSLYQLRNNSQSGSMVIPVSRAGNNLLLVETTFGKGHIDVQKVWMGQ